MYLYHTYNFQVDTSMINSSYETKLGEKIIYLGPDWVILAPYWNKTDGTIHEGANEDSELAVNQAISTVHFLRRLEKR